jgi:hypothetical protein
MSIRHPTRGRRPAVLALALLIAVLLGVNTVAVVQATNGGSPAIVFLARADNPVDALAAGGVAGQLGARLYLTSPTELSTVVADALTADKPDVVVLAGGTAALQPQVEADVKALLPGVQVVRLAGATRLETADLVNKLLAQYPPAFARSATSCDAGQVVTGMDAAGNPVCAPNPPETLPSGRSQYGAYGFDDHGTAAGADYAAVISFPVPLAEDPVAAHFIRPGEAPPAECPGTFTAPAALPGHVCIFEGMGGGYAGVSLWCLGSGCLTDRFGQRISFYDDGTAGDLFSFGRWVVTAP